MEIEHVKKLTERTFTDIMRLMLSRIGFFALFNQVDENDKTKSQVAAWIAENGRDKRAPHKYSIDTFGLTEEGLKRDYAFYREAFGFK